MSQLVIFIGQRSNSALCGPEPVKTSTSMGDSRMDGRLKYSNGPNTGLPPIGPP
ncbi:hypothetical protein EGR_01841 [Echinococcus granulosus]|uniref:Uncharacterized protein n=1 Tax=Echinococcus granulosus TaxID=6210 RepID=W6UNV9_ECHGR|nr:hypothetical protein EGR_01841 [Echinococcus granulosus]EUB63350.1 hypothetical protein EGR_01841 [Echinococcus granulosus]